MAGISEKTSGVLSKKRMPITSKCTFFFFTKVSPTMLYGSEYWAVNEKTKQRISVVEIRMLRWMSGVTREDSIRNKYLWRNLEEMHQFWRKSERIG